MTQQKIGTRLDNLGLLVDVEEGDHVSEAVVTVVTQHGDAGFTHHEPVRVPAPKPRPVPCPVEQRIITVVEENQVISEGQRQRVCAWLEANGIDPKFVTGRSAITVRSRVVGGKEGAFQIRYTEYSRDENGQKFCDQGSDNRALTIQRCIAQKVPLGEDPEVKLR